MSDHEDMLWRSEAVESVLGLRAQALHPIATTPVSLDAIGGRTLARDVEADRSIPPIDRATMDGYALRATDGYPLEIVDGQMYPEDEPEALPEEAAIRIATGASLPQRADTVLKVEDATVEDGLLRGPELDPGTYTYERGSNVRAGETLFTAGEVLSPKDAVLLGDLGVDAVEVYDPFAVGVLATGTEIHEGKQPDLDSDTLVGLIDSWGHEPVYEGTAPDEYDQVRNAIRRLADEYDVVVTTGGTSVGQKDHVVRALSELGVVCFHRVRVRPGKPLAVADLCDAVAFAVPGKPVGAHTIATLILRPFFIGHDALPSTAATLTRDVDTGMPEFEYVVPVELQDGEAMPLGHVDSPLAVYERTFDPSILSSSTRATRADGFFVTEDAREAGEMVSVVPYDVVE